MNPCTSGALSPRPSHLQHSAHGAGAPPPAGALESHGLQLLEMGTKEQDYEELRELLHSWDVADLLPHLQDEAINVDELQMIKRHHLSELLRNFRFGTRIRFEHHLERWRRWLNVPLQGPPGQGSAHCPGCRCSEVQSQVQAQALAQPILCPPGPQTQLDEKSEDLARTLPAESLVALGEPREMGVPFQALPPAPQSQMMVVKEEMPSGPTAVASEDAVQQQDGGVSVLGILQASGSKAQSLLSCVHQMEPLDAVQRLLLIQLVCSYYEDNQLHLTLQRSHLLESEILALYPGEQLHYYRTERRGKIYVRFTNMKRNKRLNTSRQELKRRRADLGKPGSGPGTAAGAGAGTGREQVSPGQGTFADGKANVSFAADQSSSPERSD
ncbi:hypothetical protein KR018_003194 [Drosophila ironensis]|nr:hypothetical protein KR018_003194 [Drosophila ironensis]